MVTRNFTVTTSVQQIIPYNARRKAWIIRNRTAQECFVSENQDDPATKGFPLNQFDSLSATERDGDEPDLPMYAVVSAGTADIRIIEKFGKAEKAEKSA